MIAGWRRLLADALSLSLLGRKGGSYVYYYPTPTHPQRKNLVIQFIEEILAFYRTEFGTRVLRLL